MSYRATATEWLALGAVAQQPSGSLSMYALRIYLRDFVGHPRAITLIHHMIKGGLLDYSKEGPTVTITEWALQSRRAKTASPLPAYIAIPDNIASLRARKH